VSRPRLTIEKERLCTYMKERMKSNGGTYSMTLDEGVKAASNTGKRGRPKYVSKYWTWSTLKDLSNEGHFIIIPGKPNRYVVDNSPISKEVRETLLSYRKIAAQMVAAINETLSTLES
jgi:hypothetical protein